MRHVILLLAFLVAHSIVSGQAAIADPETIHKRATFVTVIDLSKATKEGIYLEGYVVHIPYRELERLNGKRVRIEGRIRVVKGVRYSSENEISQGREKDALHIRKPKITIIN